MTPESGPTLPKHCLRAAPDNSQPEKPQVDGLHRSADLLTLRYGMEWSDRGVGAPLAGPGGDAARRGLPVADDCGALCDERGRASDLDRPAEWSPEERMPKDHRGGEQESARGERTDPPARGRGQERAALVGASLDGITQRVEKLAELGGGVHDRTLPFELGG